MDLGIAGRVALVTGGSRGIGRAIAAELVAEGARVALASRSRDALERATREIGGHAHFVYDSNDVEAAPDLVGQVADELGTVEILIINTGGPPATPDPLSATREQWQAAYQSLVLTPMALIGAVAPGMRQRAWGRIVCVSSSAVQEVIPELVLSGSHRAATLAAMKTLSLSLAGQGITLNTLLPGRIATERLAALHGSMSAAERAAADDVPTGRLGRPEEMAAAATFLCSSRAAYITGEALRVDGGLTRSP